VAAEPILGLNHRPTLDVNYLVGTVSRYC